MFARDLAKLMLLQLGLKRGCFQPSSGRLRLHVQSSLILYAPRGFPALIEINIVYSPDGLVRIGLAYGNMY